MHHYTHTIPTNKIIYSVTSSTLTDPKILWSLTFTGQISHGVYLFIYFNAEIIGQLIV